MGDFPGESIGHRTVFPRAQFYELISVLIDVSVWNERTQSHGSVPLPSVLTLTVLKGFVLSGLVIACCLLAV